MVIALAVGVGWPHYLGIPAKKTLAAVIGLCGAGSAVAAASVPAPGYLDWTPGFIALGVISVFVVQLVRGTGQAQRLESTLGCCVGVLLSCLGAGWIAGARFTGGVLSSVLTSESTMETFVSVTLPSLVATSS